MAPQRGQKVKVTLRPESPFRTKSTPFPSIRTPARSKRACTPKALPVLRWHAWQWQTDTQAGAQETWARSCPQLQDAIRNVMARGREASLVNVTGILPQRTLHQGWRCHPEGGHALQEVSTIEADDDLETCDRHQTGFSNRDRTGQAFSQPPCRART